MVDGDPQVPALNPSRAGDRFDEEGERRRTNFDRDVRLGGFDPDEWVKDNETDGVWGGVLFPSMSLVFYGIEDTELLSAVCRVYTDWAIEFAGAHPDRLRAVAMINVDDVRAPWPSCSGPGAGRGRGPHPGGDAGGAHLRLPDLRPLLGRRGVVRHAREPARRHQPWTGQVARAPGAETSPPRTSTCACRSAT